MALRPRLTTGLPFSVETHTAYSIDEHSMATGTMQWQEERIRPYQEFSY